MSPIRNEGIGGRLRPQHAVPCAVHAARILNGEPRPLCVTWNASGRCDVPDPSEPQIDEGYVDEAYSAIHGLPVAGAAVVALDDLREPAQVAQPRISWRLLAQWRLSGRGKHRRPSARVRWARVAVFALGLGWRRS